jgi:hypothetical protein
MTRESVLMLDAPLQFMAARCTRRASEGKKREIDSGERGRPARILKACGS